MAKKKKRVKKPEKDIEEEKPEILDETEKRNMEYIFIGLFAASIVFLLVYLAGFISILLR
ncbi:MAG: hypothetical protein ABFD07_16690 [Methanobacterium sp.]